MYDQSNQQLAQRLGATKPTQQRDPYIGEGESDLIVEAVETYMAPQKGQTVRLKLIVERTTSTDPQMKPGSTVVRIWSLYKPAKYETQDTAADEYVAFCNALQGKPNGDPSGAELAVKLITMRSQGGLYEDQPARGIRVHCSARTNVSKSTGKPFTVASFFNLPQDADKVKATRAALDAQKPWQMPSQQVQPQYGQPQQQAAPQPWGQQPAMQVPQGFGPQPGYPAQPAPAASPFPQAQPQSPIQQPAAPAGGGFQFPFGR